MRLNLHNSIFTQKNDIDLSHILVEAYKKRLSVHVVEEANYNLWVSERTKSEQAQWALVIKSSASLHMNANTTCVFQISDDIGRSDWGAKIPNVHINDVDYILRLPITVAVENSRNDRNFLLSVCKSSLRERLLELEKQQALVFDGGGGINELVHNMKDKYISHPAKKYKHWMLFDGDSTRPGEIVGSANDLIHLCNENDYNNFHCLSRRAIENYLPISDNIDIEELYSLFHVDDDEFKERLVCFSNLSKEQRYHYHMKEGLTKTNCKDSGLYNDFDKKTKKLIGKGFKIRIDSIFDCGKDASFEDFEPIHQLHIKADTPKEMSALLRQLDFNTRKMK
ncbi:MAG: hypothetical protein QNK36_06170 [Colwellia sp.]|nr:hypothetical protein [Colwellia sp.]